MSTTVIILAAGKGTRMRSQLPKVLQPLAGRPLLGHVIATAKQLNADHIITIYGHGGEQVQQHFKHEQVQWVEQAEQLGRVHRSDGAIRPDLRTGTRRSGLAAEPARVSRQAESPPHDAWP